MHWLMFALLSGISFGGYNFFTKLSANKFSPTISLMLITGTAFVASLMINIFLKLLDHKLVIDKAFISKPIMGGLLYALAMIFYIVMFSKGAPVSIGSPLVVGIVTLVVSFLGILVLGERYSLFNILGVVCVLIGLFLISIKINR